MNTKQKCLYTVLGACIMLAGTIIGAAISPLSAQNGKVTFGEITCTGLKVVDAAG